jgi:anti-sigma B factor antagonist
MPQESTQNLHLNFVNGVAVISFATPYLQTEDAIAKVGAELFELADRWDFTKVLITFEGVRFVSSSMLAQVVKLHKQLAKTKGKVRLCVTNPSLREVLRASQLDRLMEVFDDEKAALAKF